MKNSLQIKSWTIFHTIHRFPDKALRVGEALCRGYNTESSVEFSIYIVQSIKLIIYPIL